MGSNLLMSEETLRHLGMDPLIVDAARADGPAADRAGRRPKAPARPFVIHHLNADKIPQSIIAHGSGLRQATTNIGFLLWEFPVLPREHRLAIDMLDDIWAPSDFVRQAYQEAGAPSVVNIGKAIALPKVAKMDMRRFGIEPRVTTFLTCFDFHSSLQRKNPLAAVEGFLAAFEGRDDVRLIVKTTPPSRNHWGDAGQWARIEVLAGRDPRITLITERLPFVDLLSLVKGADCLVSPHRSEGFGLLPAYALAMATPVIATDYSGTRDFCNPMTSFPIPYQMVPVGPKDALFQMEGACWAEVDREALALAMRDFADDPMDGRMRAARGRQLIASKYAPYSHAQRCSRRLRELGVLMEEPCLMRSV